MTIKKPFTKELGPNEEGGRGCSALTVSKGGLTPDLAFSNDLVSQRAKWC